MITTYPPEEYITAIFTNSAPYFVETLYRGICGIIPSSPFCEGYIASDARRHRMIQLMTAVIGESCLRRQYLSPAEVTRLTAVQSLMDYYCGGHSFSPWNAILGEYLLNIPGVSLPHRNITHPQTARRYHERHLGRWLPVLASVLYFRQTQTDCIPVAVTKVHV